jgi:hypothetical protein
MVHQPFRRALKTFWILKKVDVEGRTFRNFASSASSLSFTEAESPLLKLRR